MFKNIKTETELLMIQNVCKNFGGIKALKNVTVSLPSRKITGIIGPNGAGKTTLFNAITGFIRPDQGHIIYKGLNITNYSPDEIAHLGITRGFQNLRLFEKLTVLENVIIYSSKQEGESLLVSLLPFLIDRRENKKAIRSSIQLLKIVGLNEKLNVEAGNLSYAEQKLLNLARILVMPGSLILLDEPMSGVDINVINKIIKVIRKIPQMGKTVCVIEHSLDFIEAVSDEVIFLAEGEVLFQGEMKRIFERHDLADLYLGV